MYLTNLSSIHLSVMCMLSQAKCSIEIYYVKLQKKAQIYKNKNCCLIYDKKKPTIVISTWCTKEPLGYQVVLHVHSLLFCAKQKDKTVVHRGLLIAGLGIFETAGSRGFEALLSVTATVSPSFSSGKLHSWTQKS